MERTVFTRVCRNCHPHFHSCMIAARRTCANIVRFGPVSEQLPEICALSPQTLTSHADVYRFSLDHSDEFWGTLARSRLKWFQPFSCVAKHDAATARHSWFIGGKLNVAYNCIDRHVQSHPNRTALIWEKDSPGQHETVSYRQLHVLVCRLANLLKSCGVAKGDRVAVYLPSSPIAVAAMLACARIGAVHTVVFAGFSAAALAARIQDAEAMVLITIDEGLRGGKLLNFKTIVDDAVSQCPSIRHVLIRQRSGSNSNLQRPLRYTDLDEALSRQSEECLPEACDSEDPLFLLYTSGSTGKPKGLLHTHAGYLLYALITHKLVFNYSDGEIFGCMADVGWITGHSYSVYGVLANGGTSVLFESIPTYPDPGRYWELVQRLRITHFYTAPTAIRLLLRFPSDYVNKYDRSSLKVLGSVGEPLNKDAYDWYFKVVGSSRCTLVDTWWQTETGGIMIAPSPADPGAQIKSAKAMRPFYGIEPVLVDANQTRVLASDGTAADGALCIARPWPGMARSIFGDHSRFLQTYFTAYPGMYFTGDGAALDEDGHFTITGRMDDVLNVSGHRLGTAEVEAALDSHDGVAESAVVGVPHEIKGESVFAFVTLKDSGQVVAEEALAAELKAMVKASISSFAVPETILITTQLPKTRSGKILRRLLRKIAVGQCNDLGDVTTLADPLILKELIDKYNLQKQSSA